MFSTTSFCHYYYCQLFSGPFISSPQNENAKQEFMGQTLDRSTGWRERISQFGREWVTCRGPRRVHQFHENVFRDISKTSLLRGGQDKEMWNAYERPNFCQRKVNLSYKEGSSMFEILLLQKYHFQAQLNPTVPCHWGIIQKPDVLHQDSL